MKLPKQNFKKNHTILLTSICLLLSMQGLSANNNEATPSTKGTEKNTQPDKSVKTDKLKTTNTSTEQKVVVWGELKPSHQMRRPNPVSTLSPEDMLSINATTSEDLINYEPGLIVRKRFIGDSNGTLGIRGSNMFQTTRSMVFADGVPLHYFLQTRWSGAPRWSLVSADEIAQVEVVYGPYSAEYSGNSMGGVVNIETAIPTERKFRLEGSIFSHEYQALGFDDTLYGYKGFVSYADKFDNFTIYTSYNHLENEGHPQSYRFDKPSAPDGDEQAVTGAIEGVNEYGERALYYADNGIADITTDNYKVKLGYEFEKWQALVNLAYEDRKSENRQTNNYLRDQSGTPVWSGPVVQNNETFRIRESRFTESELKRESLLLGLRLQGELTANWWLEADISQFEVLKDESANSLTNSKSPAYSLNGEIREYDNTGWQTAAIKLQNESLFNNDSLNLTTGLRFESYELAINNYDSTNYLASEKTQLTGKSGGETSLKALFVQLEWEMTESWDMTLGARQEEWQSTNGFYNEQLHPDRKESRFSPKFSTGWQVAPQWQLRYSAASAFRFPIVEELFQNERSTQGTALANANLEPEDGRHQNLMLEKIIDDGYVQLNYFTETIDDVIFAQSSIVDNRSIRTFIPIDSVKTDGVELIFNQIGLFNDLVDFRFNTTYIDSKVVKNSANTELEGKVFPRIPRWRANLLTTFHLTELWNVGGGVRYASNSYGDLNNKDTASNVYGAHDGYLLFNLKTNYQLNDNTTLSLGIDNLTDESVFVHHPWPQRTLYLEASLDF